MFADVGRLNLGIEFGGGTEAWGRVGGQVEMRLRKGWNGPGGWIKGVVWDARAERAHVPTHRTAHI